MRWIPETPTGKIAAGFAAVALAGAAFWLIAPYNIAASTAHLPGVTWVLHGYMKNAVRTWSMGIEPPDYVDLGDEGLVRLGASHFETGCAPCHGAPGRTRNPLMEGMLPSPPKLGDFDYEPHELYWIVRHGLKYTGMPGWAGADRPDEPWAVAAFLMRLPALDGPAYARLIAAETVERGEGFGFEPDVPEIEAVCDRCHGRDGLGRDGTAPKLAGQSEAYLRATLDAYAEGRRQSGIMEPLAIALTEEDRRRLAARYAAMPPFGASGEGDPRLARVGAALARQGDEDDEVPSCLSCHGDGQIPERKPLYPRLAGQDRLWLTIWLHRWKERPLGGTQYATVMHQASHTLTEDDIAALAAFYANGGR